MRTTYSVAVKSNCGHKAQEILKSWISWAKRCRLEPFKRLATTLKECLSGVVRGMLDGRTNAYVEAMNGMLQQIKRAARGFRSVTRDQGIKRYRAGRQVPLKTA
ncbi:hypothetical protein CS8_096540 [Cupriavidus sp. 8B]